MKILYVEDDWFFRRELSDMVKRITGIDIRLAGTLEEGLSVIESEKLDLVVSDLNLTDSKEIEGF
jgi:DNA-binding response OmpR family regulator